MLGHSQAKERTNDSQQKISETGGPLIMPPELEVLMNMATPRSQLQLQKIAQAAVDGRLTESDIDLLEQIASRLSDKE